MEDVNTKDMAPRRCELQFNSAGAWRSGLQFDATTVTPEFLQSADLMCRLADCGTTMRVVLCDPPSLGRSVLMHWSRESGWMPTSIPLSGDAGAALAAQPGSAGDLTDAQKHVLAMAAFCIAARGDENVVLQEDDAERILELLLQLSGLDVDCLSGSNVPSEIIPVNGQTT